jgi:hypothetical protein
MHGGPTGNVKEVCEVFKAWRRRVHRQQHAELVARAAAFCRLLCGSFSCSAKVCYVPVVMQTQPRSMALPGNELQLHEAQVHARPLEALHVYNVSGVELEHGVKKQTRLLLDARDLLKRGTRPLCACC